MMTSTGMNAFGELTQLARKTAALMRAAGGVLDDVISVNDESPARLEDLAHLFAAASEAAEATVRAALQLEQVADNHRCCEDA